MSDNISVSWWFKDQGKHSGKSSLEGFDFSLICNIAVRRNLERLVGTSVTGKGQGHLFFLAIAGGKLSLPCTTPKDCTLGRVMSVGGSSSGNGGVFTRIPELEFTPLKADAEAAKNIVVHPSWEATLLQTLQAAQLVLPAGTAPQFLRDLVAGRFCDVKLK